MCADRVGEGDTVADGAVLPTVMSDLSDRRASLQCRLNGSRCGMEEPVPVPLVERISKLTTIAGRFPPIRGGSQLTGAISSQLVTFSEVL